MLGQAVCWGPDEGDNRSKGCSRLVDFGILHQGVHRTNKLHLRALPLGAQEDTCVRGCEPVSSSTACG